MLNTIKCAGKNDEELVSLSLRDQEFFLCIVKNYEAKLARYIARISNFSAEERQDILQEIFIKVYKNLNAFDNSLKFSSWIYRIAHNETISHFRKSKSRPQIVAIGEDNRLIENLASDLDLEKEIDHNILTEKIITLLGLIDYKYREVLILRFLEDKSYQEISDILKKPQNTVATLINRAKKKLIDQIQKTNFKI